ncbi:MAG: helix-turn-helix transcriptional regulator [Pseudomonadota bacterium]
MSITLSELDQQLGARLRIARNLSELSMDEICTQIGLSRTDVLAFEAGRKRISAKWVAQFATLLNVEIRWFFGFDSSAPGADRSNLSSLSSACTSVGLKALVAKLNEHDAVAAQAA